MRLVVQPETGSFTVLLFNWDANVFISKGAATTALVRLTGQTK